MYLLDTNVVSELRKVRFNKANTGVAQWAHSVEAMNLYLSVISIQELEVGILLAERKDPSQGAILRTWLNQYVLPAFKDRILAIDLAIVHASAQLHVPNPRPIYDGLIAATAMVHGMTLVTRNVVDFESTGVLILNPWN